MFQTVGFRPKNHVFFSCCCFRRVFRVSKASNNWKNSTILFFLFLSLSLSLSDLFNSRPLLFFLSHSWMSFVIIVENNNSKKRKKNNVWCPSFLCFFWPHPNLFFFSPNDRRIILPVFVSALRERPGRIEFEFKFLSVFFFFFLICFILIGYSRKRRRNLCVMFVLIFRAGVFVTILSSFMSDNCN